jgi:hypothetical protein
MKKIMLLLVTILFSDGCFAQKYKDSLYNEYVAHFYSGRMAEVDFTKVLYHTAEVVFTIDNPVMRYAMKESRLEDSLAMDKLGRETMNRYLDDKFFSLNCEHFEKEMVPILKVYADELCRQVTSRMQDTFKLGRDSMAKKMEKATKDGAIAMARDKNFIEKVGKLRAEYGQDMILHSLDCQTQYLYVNCPYNRDFLIEACVGGQVDKYMAFKRLGQQRLHVALRHFIATGESDTLKTYLPNAAVLTNITRSSAAMLKRANELKADKTSILFRPYIKDGKTLIAYVYASEQPEILGALNLGLQWKDHKWTIETGSFVPVAEVQDKDALLKIATRKSSAQN